MTSQLKSDTARTNGAKSHGPTTPAGRARSSRNSLRHGLRASTVVLPTESSADFKLLLDSYTADLQPQNHVEMSLVECMVAARWRIRRILSIETQTFDTEIIRNESKIDKEFNNMDGDARAAWVFNKLADNGHAMALMIRYETAASRAYDRAFKQLRILQSARTPNPPSVRSACPDSPPSVPIPNTRRVKVTSNPFRSNNMQRPETCNTPLNCSPDLRSATMKLLAIFGIFATALLTTLHASVVSPFVQEETRWHGWMPVGQVVEINNVNGNVRAEAASGDEIEVVALKRGTGDPADVSIEVVEHKGGVTICAVYPNANTDHPFECRPSHGGGFRLAATSDSEAHIRWDNGGGGDVILNDLRVDFIVRLPKRLRFIGRTVDGEVAAHIVDQDVEVHSVRGNVTVDLDPSSGADVRGETALGEVNSEFPINVRNDRDHGTSISTHFGSSHRIVRLKSAAGNIRLQKGSQPLL